MRDHQRPSASLDGPADLPAVIPLQMGPVQESPKEILYDMQMGTIMAGTAGRRHDRQPRLAQTGFAMLLSLLLLAGFGLCGMAAAQTFDTAAKQAILVDFDTGSVLYSKDADGLMFPASMTKIMTAYLVFERLAAGSLSLGDEMLVSERAWRKGGSKMFVKVGDHVSVEDLLRGVIVQSGNDASIVLAEGIAGSEAGFAELMNARAEALGLTGTYFLNATGWPDPNHITTARDMATLAVATIRDFPEYYGYFKEMEFTYADIEQGNRNPLLYRDNGADGLKTGHTEASGYGLTGSAKRGDRRLIVVVNGLDSVRARGEEANKLLGWGFANFANYALFKEGEVVEQAEVWLGKEEFVPLTLDEDLTVTIGRRARKDMTVSIIYEGPLPAPLSLGERVATLVIDGPEMIPIERPLYVMKEVQRMGFFSRMARMVSRFIFGAMPMAAQN